MPMRRRAQAQANSAAPPNLVPDHFALASVRVVNNLGVYRLIDSQSLGAFIDGGYYVRPEGA